MKVVPFALRSLLALLLAGCAPDLEPGDYGQFRYIADVQGASPPLAVRPPRSDRDGNQYVLLDEEAQILGSQVPVYVGNRAGGWVAACSSLTLTAEDRQAGLRVRPCRRLKDRSALAPGQRRPNPKPPRWG